MRPLPDGLIGLGLNALVALGERRTAEVMASRAEVERRRASDEARQELAKRWEEGHGGRHGPSPSRVTDPGGPPCPRG